MLASFRSQSDVSKWKVFSDAAFGGKSTAALELGPEGKVRTEGMVDLEGKVDILPGGL